MDMPTSRVRFREAALNFWVALHEKDSDRANDESAECERLVRSWEAEGRAREFLEPLVRDADPEVRFAAASSLLALGEADPAIRVLEDLRAESSMIGPSAWLRLKGWERDGR